MENETLTIETLKQFAEWLAGKTTPGADAASKEIGDPNSPLRKFLRRSGRVVRKRLPLSLPPAIDPLVDRSPEDVERLRAMCRRELEALLPDSATRRLSNREVIDTVRERLCGTWPLESEQARVFYEESGRVWAELLGQAAKNLVEKGTTQTRGDATATSMVAETTLDSPASSLRRSELLKEFTVGNDDQERVTTLWEYAGRSPDEIVLLTGMPENEVNEILTLLALALQ